MRIRWAGHVGRMRDEKCIKYFGWKHEGKRLLGGHRCRWEDNIRMDLREVRWGTVDWIHLARDWNYWRALVRVVN
jgi:hypothetical protein